MELDVEGDDAEPRLQIDLGVQTTSETKTGASGAAAGETSSAMTWLQAAEHVLREERPGMHIRDLTRTILELGMVKSSCSTSLETLLYRQTSKGTSKFIRVPGKMGWFGLKGEGAGEQKPAIVLPSQAEQKVAGVVVEGRRGEEEEWDFRPKVFYKRKRASECSGSGSEESGWSSSSDEDSEALYHKKYIFVKKMAKGIIYENVALADQLSLIEHKISTAQAERNFLLQKLMKFERDRQISSGKRSASSTSSTTTTTTGTATTPATTDPTTPATTDPIPTLSPAAAATGSVVTLATGSAGPAKGGSPALSIPHLIHVSSILQNRGGGGGGGSNVSSELSAAALLASKQPLAMNLSLSSSLSALLRDPAEAEGLGSEAAVVESPTHSGAGETEPAESIRPTSQKSLPQMSADTSSSVSSSSSSESDAEEGTGGGGGRGVKRKRVGDRGGGDGDESSGVKGGRSDEGATKSKSGGGSVGKKKGSRQGRRLHPVPLKEDGSPVLPIQIGGLKVHKLGKIVFDRPAYHSERYLLPVGFESSRTYPSMQSPTRRTTYQCRILDRGDAPIFEMSADDDPLNSIQASSSTACQTIVLKAINKARDRQATNSGSGPEFFGYSNPTILNLIQKLPNAGRCTKYKFNRFETPVRPVQKPRARKTEAGRHTRKTDGLRTKRKKLGTASRPFQSISLLGGGGSGKRGGGGSGRDTQSEQDGATDPSLAPVLGSEMIQLGLEAGLGLYSSSDEWSSSESEQEVTVDT